MQVSQRIHRSLMNLKTDKGDRKLEQFESSGTLVQKQMPKVRIDTEPQSVERKQQQMRNPVAEAQKQISSQETAGVTSQYEGLF